MTKRPNIIFIVADDLGYADLGCYGGRDASFGAVSPELDKLAAGGLRFTEGYANSPVCSPTRFAMMTGRYQYRLRGAAEEPISSSNAGSAALGLPAEHPTLPSLLKDSGYRTALIGKWHLGFPPHFGPMRSGYEEFFGLLAGGADYFTHCNSTGKHDLYLGEQAHVEEGYMTDLISQRAIDFIDRMADGAHKGSPFFLSLHHTAPHWPWETRDDADVPAQISNKLFHLDGGNIDIYRRMIHHMDEGIGQLVASLRSHGLLENTLIVFTSDNGGANYIGLPNINKPYRGWKLNHFEGGIHVPFAAKWPGRIEPGSVFPHPVHHVDLFKTFAAAAGADVPTDRTLDGVDLVPYVKGEISGAPHQTLFWREGYHQSVRHGDWKLIRADQPDKPPGTGQAKWLFNLAEDPTEQRNLATQLPEKVAELEALLAAHNAEQAQPMWPSVVQDAQLIDKPGGVAYEQGDEYIYWPN